MSLMKVIYVVNRYSPLIDCSFSPVSEYRNAGVTYFAELSLTLIFHPAVLSTVSSAKVCRQVKQVT